MGLCFEGDYVSRAYKNTGNTVFIFRRIPIDRNKRYIILSRDYIETSQPIWTYTALNQRCTLLVLTNWHIGKHSLEYLTGKIMQ